MRRFRRPAVAPLLAIAMLCGGALGAARAREGRDGVGAPSALADVTVVERPGAAVPLDALLVDDRGRSVRLGRFFDGRRPVLLVLGYYRCPMLCDLVAGGVAGALAEAGLVPGESFAVVAVSIDRRDGPGDAAARRREVARLAGEESARAWAFLTGSGRPGSEQSVERLAGAVGFRYRFDPASGQYAHPAVVVALAPDGRVSGYAHGVRPEPAALERVLDSAAAFETGRSLGEVVAACFHYTPALRQWSGAIENGLRLGGLGILLAIGALFGWVGKRRRQSEGGAGR